MKKPWGLSLLGALLALLLVTACQPIQPEIPSKEDDAAAGTAAQAAPSELTGVVWQWQQTGMNDDSVTTPADPATYTLEFLPSGRLNVQADCNGGSSSYTLDGSQLTIGPIALTRMACPADSLDSVFVQQLGEVASYLMDGNNLVLELKMDSGGMTFAPAPDSAATSEEAPVASTTAPTATATLTGTIMYLQRVALPAGAVIDVQLQDVSKMDVAATVIASQVITTSGENVPIPFELAYDPAQIDERFTYALSVRITIDGELAWINTERYAVLTNGAPASGVEVMVQSAQ